MKGVKNTVIISAIIITSIIGFSFLPNSTQEELPAYDPPFLSADSVWVDSVFNSLTQEERIAQLLMVAAYSNSDKDHEKEILELVEKHGVGGLIFMQGGPVRQAKLNNLYQSKAKVPLMISIDGEWGLAMRLDSTEQYPRQMMLGAIQNDTLIYEMGKEIGRQCNRLGIHVNFSPVVDVNVNPKNPVINSRSFGENKYNVARKGVAYMKGLQDVGVMANAKHFPGHGDTDKDSHKSLPKINHSAERIDSVELYPFKELIRNGVSSMMVAHLYIPSLDDTENQASTLSPKIVQNLLKDSLDFKGLVFTDALNMKGVSSFNKAGEVDKLAFMAGNDVLLFSGDVPTAIKKIKDAIESGDISEEELNRRCKKILKAKKWLKLDKNNQVDLKKLVEDLNHPKADAMNQKLVKNAITLIKNQDQILPLSHDKKMKVASLVIGDTDVNEYQNQIEFYENVTHFNISSNFDQLELDSLVAQLDSFDIVIAGFCGTNRTPGKNFGITQDGANLIKAVGDKTNLILSFFANPYALNKVGSQFESAKAIICAYEDTRYARQFAAQMVFGGIEASAKLPVSAFTYPEGYGVDMKKVKLGFNSPVNLNMDAEHLKYVDSIALKGINEKAYPGCQILIARKGEVIFNKSYGHHTYEKKREVKTSDIYDLASVTKIASSVASLMYLVDHAEISLDSTLGTYLDYVDSTEYKDLVLRDVLAHQARLVSWIPFYTKTLVKGQLRFDLYSPIQSEEYPLQVADNLYMLGTYPDSVRYKIVHHNLHKQQEYRYSDLGYYFMKDIVESKTGLSLDEFTDSVFYQPLGALTTTYHPLEKFEKDRIPPTEYDLIFRKQLVHGHVHDPGAAIMGGVGGHAGLFSSAQDLAKLMQMYLDRGQYNGIEFVDSAVVNEFTRCQFCADDNRRGAGFDKPSTVEGGPTCQCISYASFGHSGFTGTYAWADPDKEIVYIFLSNRVYPDANNKKLIKMGIRTDIMEVIYDSIEY